MHAIMGPPKDRGLRKLITVSAVTNHVVIFHKETNTTCTAPFLGFVTISRQISMKCVNTIVQSPKSKIIYLSNY